VPIEIRELVFRATVNPAGESSGRGSPPASDRKARSSAERPRSAQDDVVQTTIREVMRILDEKRER
jgi:Family of unknown function (DUF5908)